MFSSLLLLLPAIYSLESVLAQGGQTCNATSLCPESAPCCSEFGYCGTGEFCLGGCNALTSNTPDSCTPAPVCRDATYSFADNSRILSNATYYDGNSTAYDWVLDKGAIFNTNSSGGELALLLTEDNGGTRISSTHYVHYGTITAKLKTGRWNGVVVAFITMSDIKDEIDWEFPGAKTTQGQSNFFWQGVIPEKTNGGTHDTSSDTFSDYHDYTIDWQKDTLTFLIDGKSVRTVQRSATDVDGTDHYPSTPSRVQLSIWPAGIESSPQGTIEWSGGLIDYNDPDYKSAGHFYTLIKSVEVKCADSQSTKGDITSYIYGANTTSLNPSIVLSNASTMLGAATSLHGVVGMRFATSVAAVVAGVLAFSGLIL